MRTTLYVGGFALDTREATLRNIFAEFGEITDLRMILRGSKDGGFAYITFATVHATEAALSLNGQSLCERPLRVNLAR